MLNEKNIFLIGPMGAGKSSVGKRLSLKLNMNFNDTDNEITNFYGNTVTNIFNSQGEIGFRKIEEYIINKLTKSKPIILSTGGGVVSSKNNRHMLTSRGIVIYLKVGFTQQIYRLVGDKKRPLLKFNLFQNNKHILNILCKERLSLYKSISNITISTNNLNIDNIVLKIMKNINQN